MGSKEAMTHWTVAIRYEEPHEMVSIFPAEALGISVDGKPVEFGEPACFIVADSKNLSNERGRFSDPGQAQAAAEELNRLEAQGPLDSEFIDRRNRLKKLAPNFRSFYYEGPPEARWPVEPGRYLIRDGGVGWHAEDSESLADTLADVEAAIAGDEANVYSVIDLDTGDEVPFEREVSVTIGAST
jgi:hypothetical protein